VERNAPSSLSLTAWQTLSTELGKEMVGGSLGMVRPEAFKAIAASGVLPSV
jgi:hypothetical protein